MKKIQQYTADIRRETSMLTTANSYTGGKAKVQEAAQAAKAAMVEATRLMKEFPTGAGGSVAEQNHKRLTQQKLRENLLGTSKALEAALRLYENAEAERERRDAAQATAAASSGAGRASAASAVELSPMDGGLSAAENGWRGQRQVQELDVSQAELDHHTAIVDEYTQEISHAAQEISALQRAMVDIADLTQAQGQTLDVIEANMGNATVSTEGATEQLTHASRHQRTGTKLIWWLLGLAVLIALALIVVVVHKH